MKNAPPLPNSRKAFTLIEMLVVIAIIALLSTFISSATSKAMDKSRRVGCANNLHSLCQGLIAYAADHDGDFPPHQSSSNSWPFAGEWAVSNSNFLEDYVSDSRFYFCPTDLRNKPQTEGAECQPFFPNRASGAWRTNISYTYFCGKSSSGGANGRGGPENLWDLLGSSSCTMVADLMKLGGSIPEMSATPSSAWNHRGSTFSKSGGNLGYADGHVAWITLGSEISDGFVNKSGGRYYINQQPDE